MSNVLYVDNTGYVSLSGYKNGLTGDYINDATVTLNITDLCGVDITGVVQPISMNYVTGSNGDYSATISTDLDIQAFSNYQAVIEAVSSGVKSKFYSNIEVLKRSS